MAHKIIVRNNSFFSCCAVILTGPAEHREQAGAKLPQKFAVGLFYIDWPVTNYWWSF